MAGNAVQCLFDDRTHDGLKQNLSIEKCKQNFFCTQVLQTITVLPMTAQSPM
jgi:hypothetical protein